MFGGTGLLRSWLQGQRFEISILTGTLIVTMMLHVAHSVVTMLLHVANGVYQHKVAPLVQPTGPRANDLVLNIKHKFNVVGNGEGRPML
mmetsp:Transcript_24074/g.55105  ORF Transcript_24074/g.55105 Transcript_24074/m.55105 type:complete len:89 (+) Transcript_24074:65-331(+)